MEPRGTGRKQSGLTCVLAPVSRNWFDHSVTASPSLGGRGIDKQKSCVGSLLFGDFLHASLEACGDQLCTPIPPITGFRALQDTLGIHEASIRKTCPLTLLSFPPPPHALRFRAGLFFPFRVSFDKCKQGIDTTSDSPRTWAIRDLVARAPLFLPF